MTAGHAAGWSRLQQVSIHHANVLGPKYARWYGERQHCPPEVIRENAHILGRGTEHDIKNRLHWYVTYYPTILNESRNA